MNILTKQRVYWLIIKKQIEKKKHWLFLWKRTSSNLSVDRIKLMVAFKMSDLVMTSKDGFPCSNVWVNGESVIFNNFQSIFLILLRRENRSLLYMGEWSKKSVVDSKSAAHLHNGFSKSSKLCLNLSSRRWLRPKRSFVKNLIPCGLWHSNTLLGEGLINFGVVF